MKNIFVCGGISHDQIMHVDSFPAGGEQTIFPGEYFTMAGGTYA